MCNRLYSRTLEHPEPYLHIPPISFGGVSLPTQNGIGRKKARYRKLGWGERAPQLLITTLHHSTYPTSREQCIPHLMPYILIAPLRIYLLETLRRSPLKPFQRNSILLSPASHNSYHRSQIFRIWSRRTRPSLSSKVLRPFHILHSAQIRSCNTTKIIKHPSNHESHPSGLASSLSDCPDATFLLSSRNLL